MLSFPLETKKIKNALYDMAHQSYYQLCNKENDLIINQSTSSYTFEKIENYSFIKEYNRYGILIDLFDKPNRYYKFSLPINLADKVDFSDNVNKIGFGNLISVFDRSSLNRTSIEIFVNGEKINDTLIYISIFESGIDLYLPRVFEADTINLIVRTKYYNNEKKYNYQTFVSTSNDFDFNYNLNEKQQEGIRIFQNGLLLDKDIDFTITDSKIILTNKDNSMYTYEIYIDYDFHKRVFIENQTHRYLLFGEEILFNLPINMDLLEIYQNGKILNNKEILNVLTSRIFKFSDDFDISNLNIFIYYYDLHKIRYTYSYFDPINCYFKLCEPEQIVAILDKNFDIESDLPIPNYMKELKFDPFYIDVFNQNPYKYYPTYQEWLYRCASDYIKHNSYNIYYLFRQFADVQDQVFIESQEQLDIRERNDTLNEVLVNETYFDSPRYVYNIGVNFNGDYVILAFINDIKIDDDDFLVIKDLKCAYIYLDKSIIKPNDKVSFKIIEVKNNYQINSRTVARDLNIPFNNYLIYDGNKVTFKKSDYRIYKTFDLLLCKIVEEGFLYFEAGTDYTIQEENDDEVSIIMTDEANIKIGEQLFIINSSYYRKYEFLVSENDAKDEIYFFNFDENYPLITNYYYIAYLNGRRLINDLDFIVSTPTRSEIINTSKFISKRKLEIGDKIEIYFIEQPKRQMLYQETINSKYGAIYLKHLPFTFSLDYLNMYINGMKVEKEDIEIYSDRFLRILNSKFFPVYDVMVETNLTFPIGYTDRLAYNPDANENVKDPDFDPDDNEDKDIIDGGIIDNVIEDTDKNQDDYDDFIEDNYTDSSDKKDPNNPDQPDPDLPTIPNPDKPKPGDPDYNPNPPKPGDPDYDPDDPNNRPPEIVVPPDKDEDDFVKDNWDEIKDNTVDNDPNQDVVEKPDPKPDPSEPDKPRPDEPEVPEDNPDNKPIVRLNVFLNLLGMDMRDGKYSRFIDCNEYVLIDQVRYIEAMTDAELESDKVVIDCNEKYKLDDDYFIDCEGTAYSIEEINKFFVEAVESGDIEPYLDANNFSVMDFETSELASKIYAQELQLVNPTILFNYNSNDINYTKT